MATTDLDRPAIGHVLTTAAIERNLHTNWSVSLDPAVSRVHAATSSVLYAVTQPVGRGELLTALRTIAAKPTVFSYGTVETSKGLAVQRGDGVMGEVVDWAYLNSKIPYPFSKEFDPRPDPFSTEFDLAIPGMHVHDKFIIADFNGDNPTVFTGSSNLSEGGEKANGGNLIMIEDKELASICAIEALKFFDHYSFRDKMKAATSARPLQLWYPSKPGAAQPWWTPAYDQNGIKFRDRCLFANIPLPATLQSHKDVDWSSIAPRWIGENRTDLARRRQEKGSGQSAAGLQENTKPAGKRKHPQEGAVKKKGLAKRATAKKGAAKQLAVKRPAARKPSKQAITKRVTKWRGN
jgi:hypothetical protein